MIDKLEHFLLELGKGFLFEARQKRFTFDDDDFFVDLVFYNRLLRCYVLIDLKIGRLTHQDLGQMQMYVNYFDRYVKTPDEHPTVGMILCKQKRDSPGRTDSPQRCQYPCQPVSAVFAIQRGFEAAPDGVVRGGRRAMNPERLLQHFDRISEAPDAIPRLRRFILDLAVRGKLVEQDPNDEPAAELLKRIQAEKARLVKEGKIKEQKPISQPSLMMAACHLSSQQTGIGRDSASTVHQSLDGATSSKSNRTYCGRRHSLVNVHGHWQGELMLMSN